MPIGGAADHLRGTFTAVAVRQGCGGDSLLPREHLPVLEMFLGLTVRGVPLASKWERSGFCSTSCNAEDSPSAWRIILPQMSIGLRLENTALKEPKEPPYLSPSSSPCQLTESRFPKLEVPTFGLCQTSLKWQHTSGFPWHYILGLCQLPRISSQR